MGTVDDLRAALDDAAEAATFPDAGATVAEVQRRVAERRRRVRTVAATVLALVVVGAGLAATDAGRRVLAPAIGPHPDPVRTVTDDRYLTESGATRLSVTEWHLSPDQSIDLAYRTAPGKRAFIEAYCEKTGGSVPEVLVDHGSTTDYLNCVRHDFPGHRQRVWLTAAPNNDGQVALTVRGANGVGVARIAIFEQSAREAGAQPPPRPPDLDANGPMSWPQMFDTDNVFAPPNGAFNAPMTLTGRNERHALVSLVVRGPGVLTATLNGRPIAFICHEDVDDILGCPYGRPIGTTVHAWDYGVPAHVYFDFASVPGLKVGDPITIVVTPSGFVGDDWRATVSVDGGQNPSTVEHWTQR